MGTAALQIFYRFAGITFTGAAVRSRACRDACQRDVRALQCDLLWKRRDGVPPMINDDGRSMPRRDDGAGRERAPVDKGCLQQCDGLHADGLPSRTSSDGAWRLKKR